MNRVLSYRICAGIALAVPASLALGAAEWVGVSTDILKGLERGGSFALLLALAVILAVAVRSSASTLFAWLREGFAPRSVGTMAFALAAGAAVFALAHAPARYRMLSDEHDHLSVAQSFHLFHRAEKCIEGQTLSGTLRCDHSVGEVRPKTYPFILSLIYGLFGENPNHAFRLNLCLFALIGLLVFRVAREIGQSPQAALFSASCWYLWPINSLWARSAGYEMLASCLVLSVLALALCLLRSQEVARAGPGKAWSPAHSLSVALGALSAFAAQTRPESIALVLAALVPAAPLLLRQPRVLLGFSLAFSFGLLPWATLRAALRDWDFNALAGDGSTFHPANLWDNLIPNLKVLANFGADWLTSLPLATLGLTGATFALAKRAREPGTPSAARWGIAGIASVSVASFTAISLFRYGRMDVSANTRYVIGILPGWSVLSGFALDALEAKLAPKLRGSLAFLGLATLAILSGGRIENEGRMRGLLLPRENEEIARLVSGLDPRSVFFYSRPQAFLIQGKSAYLYDSLDLENSAGLDALRRRSGENLYFVSGLDCRDKGAPLWRDLDEREACARIARLFKMHPVASARILDSYDLEVFRVGEATQSPESR